MGKNEQFHQYGYDHYLKAPKKPRPPSQKSVLAKGSLGRSLQSPAVASVALLAAAVLFTGVVIATYPSSKKEEQSIPIVQADLSPVKRDPVKRGGMDIRHAESTVLSRVEAVDMPQGVENLLARKTEVPPVMKEEAIEIAMEKTAQTVAVIEPSVGADGYLEARGVDDNSEKTTVSKFDDVKPTVSVVPDVKEPKAPVIEVVSSNDIDAADVLQKIGSSNASETSGFETRVALAAVAVKPRHKPMHAPGQSPETLEFVRSVLGDKAPKSSAKTVANVEPAAGSASRQGNLKISSGNWYVQLASIKDRARAGKEWLKMKAKYSALDSSDYRVQQASLNSGTFYRIQAGPMSKTSAQKVCNSLKTAKKPGGCLVVKK